MTTEKLVINSSAVMPVIAALPYSILMEENEVATMGNYNPKLQQTIFAVSSGSSTCRNDDSINRFPMGSKSDTSKDD